MRTVMVASLCTCLAFPAWGQSGPYADSMEVAHDLGNVLASERHCGLSFDHRAIEQFIDEKVSASDMGFASSLNMMTVGSEAQIGDMSPSSLTAHCAQIRRVARSYGFTAD